MNLRMLINENQFSCRSNSASGINPMCIYICLGFYLVNINTKIKFFYYLLITNLSYVHVQRLLEAHWSLKTNFASSVITDSYRLNNYERLFTEQVQLKTLALNLNVSTIGRRDSLFTEQQHRSGFLPLFTKSVIVINIVHGFMSTCSMVIVRCITERWQAKQLRLELFQWIKHNGGFFAQLLRHMCIRNHNWLHASEAGSAYSIRCILKYKALKNAKIIRKCHRFANSLREWWYARRLVLLGQKIGERPPRIYLEPACQS